MWIGSCCVLLLVFSECLTTKITKLDVPSEVLMDGDVDELLLDCQYELESEEELVVFWHHNDALVYQWILNSKPSTKPSLVDHVDLNYNVSEVPSQQYRALRLINPDASFSGNYTCVVSTLDSEDRQVQHLQFYDPGDELSLTYSLQDGNDTDLELNDLVEIRCDVAGAYPLPDLTIYVDGEVVNQTQINDEDAEGFNSTATASVPVSELTEGSVIRCELTLPQTGYNQSDTVTYTGGARSVAVSTTLLAGLMFLLIL